MTAIVVATKTGKTLPVFLKSVECYTPTDVDVYVAGAQVEIPGRNVTCTDNPATNFGDAYNALCQEAFKKHDTLVVCNDDIVLTPTSYQRLLEDYEYLKKDYKVGWVAAKCDYARPAQNIRYYTKRNGPRFDEEGMILFCDIVAPIFGVIGKEAWVDYPSINWLSDDIQCIDITANGFKNFVSRSYVHHVGSQTVGEDFNKCWQEAEPWIKANRPELHSRWYK